MGKIIKMGMPATPVKKTNLPNNDLKNQLLAKGYYVQAIGRGGLEDVEYLIVSTSPPKQTEVIQSSSN